MARDRTEPHRRPTAAEMDERVNIDHDDPEAVIKALLKVDPDAPEPERAAKRPTD